MTAAPPAWWRAPLARLGAWREQRALARRAIPDDLWALTLQRLPFLARLDDTERADLRRLCSLFLDHKSFHGVGGLDVTDDMALMIAAQACLPVLRLGLHFYDPVVGVIVHPERMVVQQNIVDEDGVVHEFEDELAGELTNRGLIELAWPEVEAAGEDAVSEEAYNVVIHEFVHLIDAATGEIDGVPPLPDRAAREHWIAIIDPAWEAFCALVDDGVETVVDPYGAEAVDEFFAVAVEAFFVAPAPFKRESPALYELLAGYFKQDPAVA